MPKINWVTKPIDIPVFEASRKHPKNKYRNYNLKLVRVSPKRFVRLQLKINPELKYKEIDRGLYKAMKSGMPIPAPIIEYHKNRTLYKPWQEGYKRGKIAILLKQKTMPVWIAKRRF